MNDATMWAEPCTAALLSNCVHGERILCCERDWGLVGEVQMLEHVTGGRCSKGELILLKYYVI